MEGNAMENNTGGKPVLEKWLNAEIATLEKDAERRGIELAYLKKKYDAVINRAGALRLTRKILFAE